MGKRRKTRCAETNPAYFHLVPSGIAQGVFFAALWMLHGRDVGVELTPVEGGIVRFGIALLACALTWAPLSLIALRFAGPDHHFVILYGVGALVYILAFLSNGFFWTGVLLQRGPLTVVGPHPISHRGSNGGRGGFRGRTGRPVRGAGFARGRRQLPCGEAGPAPAFRKAEALTCFSPCRLWVSVSPGSSKNGGNAVIESPCQFQGSTGRGDRALDRTAGGNPYVPRGR